MVAQAIRQAKTVDLLSLVQTHTKLRKIAAHEYAGPCPICGGRDRFHVHDTRGWFCRTCTGEPDSGGHWNDGIDFVRFTRRCSFRDAILQLNGRAAMSQDELEQMVAERERREAEQRAQELAEQERVHRELTEKADWKMYAAHPDAARLWAERGVSKGWVDYYGLGFCPRRTYAYEGGFFDSPSLTIPYHRATMTPHPEGGDETEWSVIGLQHRLLVANPPGGKYRPHAAGAGKQIFWTDLLQRRPTGTLLIVEGEVKAIITWAAFWTSDLENLLLPGVTVCGVPGKGWKSEWAETFRQAERVVVCLDPDARKSAARLVEVIGTDKAKQLDLPEKIDDLIIAGALDAHTLYGLMG